MTHDCSINTGQRWLITTLQGKYQLPIRFDPIQNGKEWPDIYIISITLIDMFQNKVNRIQRHQFRMTMILKHCSRKKCEKVKLGTKLCSVRGPWPIQMQLTWHMMIKF